MKTLDYFKNLSAFQRVVVALILGILAGVIVGEPAGHLKVVGNAYIGLLQMTVLPYVLVSIIGGLGRLDANMAKNIGTKAAFVITFVWLATMFSLLLLPFAYPNWEAAGFYSSSLVADSPGFDFIKLYIPSNVFFSMSNTIVPAVVLFSLLLGIALINVPNKSVLIDLTANVGDGLMRVASFVAKLAPLGIFAIAASAAGTLQAEELGRLQIFLWVYLIAWLLLALLVLPLLIQWGTPFSYQETMKMAGEAMITAMATGTVLVVLPMIVERCRELLKKHQMESEETSSAVDVLVPTAYSFPSAGTLLGLGFILFSAWYVGSPLSFGQYPEFVIMGVFSAFGSMAVAIPFMLDYFNLPADQFQLYLLGSVVTARFATALAALHAFVVTLLVSAAIVKRLNFRRMLNAVGIHLGVMTGIMIAAGLSFGSLIPYEYEGDKSFEAMRLMRPMVSVKKIENPVPISEEDQARSRLDIIRERGTLRVGYFSDSLPFAFRNNEGQVVGFDMEMIHALARDLNMEIETAHIQDVETASSLLANGSIDMIVGGRAITPDRALKYLYTNAYAYHTVGLIVVDASRDKFSTLSKVQEMTDLRLFIPNTRYYQAPLKNLFPNANIEVLDTPRNFFKIDHEKIDAFVFSAEVGSAWTMLYPAYSVVVPKGLKMQAPVGFALPLGEIDFAQFMNTWLKLKKSNGFQKEVYNYWILGQNIKAQERRWSVIHNVFGWDI